MELGFTSSSVPTEPDPVDESMARDTVWSRANKDSYVAEAPESLARSRMLVARYLGPAHERQFHVRYWDGTLDSATVSDAPFTIVLNHGSAAQRMFAPPSEFALGEAFVRGDFSVDGDLEKATALGDQIRARILSSPGYGRIGLLLQLLLQRYRKVASDPPRRAPSFALSGARRHSRRRDAAAVRSHYDVGNDFYSLWLDRGLVYSCAYFETGAEDLDRAQEAKLAHICRKLRLRPGDRLLDIGCGWGGLIRYAASRLGVHATGVTLSDAQAHLARARIADDGLGDRCVIELRDYRDVDEAKPFDKIVSVGMFEHVGAARMAEYFAKVHRLTKPGGLFLNHGIVNNALDDASRIARWLRQFVWREGEFIERYVFPDGELVPLHAVIREGERAGFEACDVESLRAHYALTLRHWVRRLEAHSAEAIRIVGESTYRVWRLYMAASAHAFTTGRQGISQVLFARPETDGSARVPLSRGDLYAPSTQ